MVEIAKEIGDEFDFLENDHMLIERKLEKQLRNADKEERVVMPL